MIRSVLVCSLVLIAGQAIAETQAERDARRASYIVGLSCAATWAGQPGRAEFRKNGTGALKHRKGDVSFTWSVKQDKYCYQFEGRAPKCTKWPSRDIGNEKRKVVSSVAGACL